MSGRGARWGLIAATVGTLVFIYFPLAVVIAYAFNSSGSTSWPPAGFSLRWVDAALANTGLRDAFVTSVAIAFGASAVALVLGSLAAVAVARYRFFGRQAISFVVVFPIALPGIVTGMALSTTFATTGLPLGLLAIVIGHATFCVVLVYNNVVARMRRVSRSLEEASSDLGADTWQTFRRVTFPTVRSAMLAGALLAFALSFDEVIVTFFTAGAQTTLPLFILNSINRGAQLPVVNVVAFAVIVLTAIPVWISVRLTRDSGILRRS